MHSPASWKSFLIVAEQIGIFALSTEFLQVKSFYNEMCSTGLCTWNFVVVFEIKSNFVFILKMNSLLIWMRLCAENVGFSLLMSCCLWISNVSYWCALGNESHGREQIENKKKAFISVKCTHLPAKTNDFHCVTFDGQLSVCCCLSLIQRRRREQNVVANLYILCKLLMDGVFSLCNDISFYSLEDICESDGGGPNWVVFLSSRYRPS